MEKIKERIPRGKEVNSNLWRWGWAGREGVQFYIFSEHQPWSSFVCEHCGQNTEENPGVSKPATIFLENSVDDI